MRYKAGASYSLIPIGDSEQLDDAVGPYPSTLFYY